MDKSEARTILGVDVNTSQEEIKKAYRILIKLYHPDKNPHLTNTEKKTFSRKYQQVQEAYETLRVIEQSNQQKNQDIFYKSRGETYEEFKKRKSKEIKEEQERAKRDKEEQNRRDKEEQNRRNRESREKQRDQNERQKKKIKDEWEKMEKITKELGQRQKEGQIKKRQKQKRKGALFRTACRIVLVIGIIVLVFLFL